MYQYLYCIYILALYTRAAETRFGQRFITNVDIVAPFDGPCCVSEYLRGCYDLDAFDQRTAFNCRNYVVKVICWSLIWCICSAVIVLVTWFVGHRNEFLSWLTHFDKQDVSEFVMGLNKSVMFRIYLHIFMIFRLLKSNYYSSERYNKYIDSRAMQKLSK